MDGFEKSTLVVWGTMLFLGVLFWGGVIFVAIHFISKWW